MIKRHLHNAHGTNPDEYRAKWGLAHDYPMVAPVYAALRRKLAKENRRIADLIPSHGEGQLMTQPVWKRAGTRLGWHR